MVSVEHIKADDSVDHTERIAVASKVKSNSFRVHSFEGGPLDEKVRDLCQKLRVELETAWCGNTALLEWAPPCEIRVHQDRNAYVRAVGSVGEQTLGSSLIQIQNGGVVSRKIDLLVDSNGELPALPHELTHVILADCFRGRQPPHWFDEGAAMLADTSHKRSLHERDCLLALHSGAALPLSQLLHLERFTSPSQMAPFYGQSASLLRFFCQRGDIHKVTRFSLDAVERGYASALQHHYNIGSEQELERQWKQEAFRSDRNETLQPILSVSYKP